MIRILQVGKFFHPEIGGIESVSKSLIDNIDSATYEMDILCFNTTSQSITDTYRGSTVFRCGVLFSFFSAPFSFRFFREFFRLHRKYDIIHIHTPNPFALIALFFVKPSAKLIIHWHSDILNKGILYWLIKPIESSALSKASVITGTSATYIDESEPLKPFVSKTNYIPIGSNMPSTVSSTNAIQALKSKYKRKKIVFCLGRLVSYKGFEYLIDAASYLPDDIVIVIGGDGPLYNAYQQLIQKKRLDGKVILQGRIPDESLPDYFQACDLFCLPSCEKSEAFGVVIIEALSYGKPVIATKIPGSGVSWVNQDGITGLNVEPKNAVALAAAINELIHDEKRLKQMGEAAAQRYHEHFTEARMQDAFETQYQQLIKSQNKTAKPRILIIINRLVIGGQALDTVPLADALRTHFDIEVCYGEKESDEEEALFLRQKYPHLTITKIPELRRSISWFTDVKAYKIIKKKIITGGFDIVHTHGAKSGLLGRIAAWRCGVKHIIHTFHGHVFHSYYNRFFSSCIIQMERWLGRITTTVVAISAYQRKELAEVYQIVPDEKIVTIPLGVDIDLFNRNLVSNRNSFRNQFELPENIVAVSIIGRLVQVKNPGLFIKVVVKAIREKLPVCFFVIGDGVLKQSMQQKLDEQGIGWNENGSDNGKTKVVFTSWISNIVPALQAMDIIVLTSFNEGTPLSIIEAQACGKPVVATDAGGVRDTFIDKETGFLVAQEDADQFYEKLKFLVFNQAARHQMGELANRFATDHFSREAEIRNFTAFYNSQVLLLRK